MSIAELKEQIIKRIVTTDDPVFLKEVADFLNEKAATGISTNDSDRLVNIDAFYNRLNDHYSDVLKRLAQ